MFQGTGWERGVPLEINCIARSFLQSKAVQNNPKQKLKTFTSLGTAPFQCAIKGMCKCSYLFIS